VLSCARDRRASAAASSIESPVVLPSPTHTEILQRDSKARNERNTDVLHKRAAVFLMAGALGALLTGSARPAESRPTFRGNCGPVLCITPARGWFNSVGPGVSAGRPAAWVLSGNFRFPADAAEHEGWPSVPPGKVLISFGDFPLSSRSVHWPSVKLLRLPRRPLAHRMISWQVRFAGRAVLLSVHFGSTPNAAIRSIVNTRLSAVHRDRG
jgi:hypothetical protein